MFRFLLTLVTSVFVCSLTSAEVLSGKEVLEKQKKLQKTSSELEVQKMILVDKSGGKENRTLKRVSKEFGKDLYRTMLVFNEPSDIKGTALMSWQNSGKDSDQWLYLPAQGKVNRVAKGSKKNPFMGTDFTFEDLQPEAIEDYSYQTLKEETCDSDKTCYVIESKPVNAEKAAESSYSKRILWVRKDIFATVKVEYFDKREKPIKVQTSMDFENVSKTIWRPKKIVMENLKTEHKTLMASAQLEVDSKIEDRVFTESYILKGEHTK